jgi:hypothetical protein
MKTIKKGTEVYMIRGWDGKATVSVTRLTIQSMGQKQATATKLVDGKFTKEQIYARQYHTIYPVDAVTDIEALALELAAAYKAANVRQNLDMVNCHAVMDIHISDSYYAHMRKDCEAILSAVPAVIYR